MSAVSIESVSEKVAAGLALGDADVRVLAGSRDLVALGMVADEARRRRHGARTSFVRVAEVQAAAAAKGPTTVAPAAREIRLVGPVADVSEAVAAVRNVVAGTSGIPVTGFSLAELEAAADRAGSDLRALLALLQESGLTSVAQAPADRLARGARSLAAAAEARMPVQVLTVDRPDAPLAIVNLLRSLDPARHGFRAIAPLPRTAGVDQTTGYADMRLIALSRILVPIEHVQVDWTLHGPKLAQVALTFGASDLDRVPPSDEAPDGRRRAPREEVLRNIRAAGLDPIERDGRFAPVG